MLEALREAVAKAGLSDRVEVVPRGCFGLCTLAPNLYIEPDGIWYSRFTLEDVPAMVEEHLLNNRPIPRLIHHVGRWPRCSSD